MSLIFIAPPAARQKNIVYQLLWLETRPKSLQREGHMSERGNSTPEIEVLFDLDVNCIMNVSGSDKSTGEVNNITQSPTTKAVCRRTRRSAWLRRLSGSWVQGAARASAQESRRQELDRHLSPSIQRAALPLLTSSPLHFSIHPKRFQRFSPCVCNGIFSPEHSFWSSGPELKHVKIRTKPPSLLFIWI